MSRIVSFVAVAASWLLLFQPAIAAPPPAHKEMDGVAVFSPKEIKWKEGPPSLPKGAMVAALEGDPAKEGPFVLRVKMPDGYRVPLHTHPKTERLTVLSGTLVFEMVGKSGEEFKTELTAGTFGRWEAGMKHLAWTKGETIIQLHGMGPWSIQYVNPDDDPRNQKK
ncbi:MAG: cupin domain-containing protein [Gemmataceae bacterium]